jgi:large subunit ribosomal protein L22
MALVTAQLNNYRQSPRKVRLVADLMRGKKATVALDHLAFTTRRASDPIAKLLASAIANATNNHGLDASTLYVKEVTVNGGVILYRRMPRARGSAYPIRKRTSKVVVVLEARADGDAKKKPVKAVKAKKVAPKKK